MKKRILSMLLAIVMVVGMLPGVMLMAFAEDGVTTVADLQTALDAGGTVVLGGDIDLGSTVLTFPDNTPVTIDLNENTLSRSQSGYVLELGANDDVTITGDGTVSKAGGWYFFKNDSGHLKIENGTYSKSGYDLVYMDGSSVTEITGGTFELANIFARQSDDSTGTIGGGTFTVGTISTGIWDKGISITGGTFSIDPTQYGVDTDSYTVTGNADNSYTVSEKIVAPTTYTVTFDANGGAAIDPVTVTYGERYGTLPSSAITGLAGGDKNWYLVDENGNVTDTNIKNLTKVATARDHTLFMKRSVLAPTLKITLEVPGAISDGYQYYVPGNSTRILTVTVNNENKDVLDYTYQWYKDGVPMEGATEAVLTLAGNVSDSGTYKVNVTATLKDGLTIAVTSDTASGEKEQAVKIIHAANTLSYDANGGENAPGSHYTGGTFITVESDEPSREHYTFLGWNTKADGSGSSYSGGETFTFAEDNGNGGCEVTLYAQWRADVYAVTLVANQGTIKEGDVTEYTYGVGAKLPTKVTRSGYSFQGWYDNEELKGEPVTEITATDLGDKTFYAKWKKNSSGSSRPPQRPEIDDDDDYSRDCPLYDYADLNPDAWYHDGIHFCLEEGLMNGIGRNQFAPNGITTRAMIVTILWRLEGEPGVNYAMSFKDVPFDLWYTEAIRWAASEGIVEGYGDTFGPNDPITREQMAAIMWRYAKYKGYDVSVGENTNILSYDDAFDVSEWAIPAMQWACGAGLINGVESGRAVCLKPADNTTRAQAAAILHRFCK